MLSILYEDNHIIVVIKPDGLESQSGKSFAPDMVSEIRKHLTSHPQDIHKLTKETSTASKYPQPPYVGVIHRLDRPVSGIMVYAKNPKAAASLSTSLQQGKIEKWYQAVICGKPVDNNGIILSRTRKTTVHGLWISLILKAKEQSWNTKY